MLPFLGSVPTKGSRSCTYRSRGFASWIASNMELNSFKKNRNWAHSNTCSLHVVKWCFHFSSLPFCFTATVQSPIRTHPLLAVVNDASSQFAFFPVRSVSEFGGTKYTPLLVSLSSTALCSLSHQEGQAAGGPLYFLKWSLLSVHAVWQIETVVCVTAFNAF